MTIQIDTNVFNEKYLPALKDTNRIQIFYGGAASGKSYFLAQRCIIQSFKKTNNILVARKYGNTNRNSTYRQIKHIIHEWNLEEYFTINELKIINKTSDAQIIFTGLDDVQKIKSISGIRIIWVQQASQISFDDYLQLNLRLRGKFNNPQLNYMMWFSFNPISKNNWIYKKIFDTIIYKQKGKSYYHSTYKDNKWCDEQYKKLLLSYKDVSPYHYDVYTLGKWGTFGQLVWPNYKVQDFDIYNILSGANYIASGQDFGYNDPSASVLVAINDQTLYICQELYGHKWTNTKLIDQLLNNTTYIKQYKIYADSAQPQRIMELSNAGLNIQSVNKKTIKESINNIKKVNIVIHPDCIQTIKQITNYQYKKNKQTNEYTDQPIEIDNHCCDALRYSTMEYFHWLSLPQTKILGA